MASNGNIAVFGAGQIGTRHVQSLATYEPAANLYVVDPSPDAARLTDARLAEVGAEQGERIRFGADMSALPEVIDIAVIATNSGVRLAVLEELLKSRKVRWIILEKFLFPRALDYSRAAEALEASGAAAYVNCPRRLFEGYVKLRREIDGPIRIRIGGSNWGLACNSVHWLDLFDYLRPSDRHAIKSSLSAPRQSKRAGYVEFFGSVHVTDGCGSHLEMDCDDQGPVSVHVEISDATGRRWEIFERSAEIVEGARKAHFPVPYQSRLTGEVARGLLERSSCRLVPYARSARLHELLLNEFLDVYNAFNDYEGNDHCPIT